MAAVHMTEGNITRHLISYSIPLILGNLFQLTYNAVDSIIVGRFIGKEALAAVGTANPVMSIIILGISGICIGSSVIMSEFFGARNYEQLKKEMSTTAVFGLYFSVLVAALGILASRALLKALQVPAEILDTAALYLRIIFLGAPFTYFYNALSAALKSVGDSKTPLKFLAFSSVLNGVLDIILIGIFRMGIICSAATTVIASAASAILCILYIYKKIPLLQLRKQEFTIDRMLLKRTLQFGGITALQQACQPVGKLLIQGAVNTMGIDAIATFNAVNRIDDYACLPEQSISHGITTFTAQNRGAGKKERILQGFRTGLTLEFCYWILICAVTWVLKRPFMQLFVTAGNEEVVALGCSYLSLMAVFYLFPGFTNGFQGFFRGMGNMSITLLGTFIQTSLRVIFVYLLVPRIGLNGVAVACAVGWSAMLLVEIPYCIYFVKKTSKESPL
ncbi:MAG: MATE family efflux transporter [Lachnospiraceae bacterium]|nr:MATE family efflux transporter [Lachnospiraceae bacterium]